MRFHFNAFSFRMRFNCVPFVGYATCLDVQVEQPAGSPGSLRARSPCLQLTERFLVRRLIAIIHTQCQEAVRLNMFTLGNLILYSKHRCIWCMFANNLGVYTIPGNSRAEVSDGLVPLCTKNYKCQNKYLQLNS